MDKLCYYLRHGLWSVVRGLLYEDEPVDPHYKSYAETLLWCAAGDAYNKCFSSEIVESPWHQSWLATVLIQNLKMSGMDGNIVTVNEVEALKREAEFQSVVFHLPHTALQFDILEELIHLYGQVVRADQVKQPVQNLSEEAHNFLCNNLLANPVTTNSVIQHLLCVWCPYFMHTDNELQNIYTEALEMLILELENRVQVMHGASAHLRTQTTEHICNILLCILSLLEISEDRERKLLENCFPRLLNLCESGILSRQLLYLSLVSRKRLKLAEMFIALEDETYKRESCMKSSDATVLEIIFRKLLDPVGNVHIEEMFLRVVKTNKHWIEDFVDLCGQLLMYGNTELVQTCLSNHTMSKLWPLVLLHVWKHFSDKEEIFIVLRFLLEQCKKVVSDPVFSSLCLIVEHQILVVEWCKKHGQQLSLSNKDFLELTKEHSTLEVLRRTTSLDDLEWNEVRELLFLNSETGCERDVKDKTMSISWEVTTFDGFCILRKAFTLFQASLEIEQLRKKVLRFNTDSSKTDVLLESLIPGVPAYFTHKYPSVIHKHPSLETESDSSVALENLFKEKITKELQEIKTLLCKLFPLNFRVEILENVFSLLFLRYEDFQEETSSDSGADDDDGYQELRSPESENHTKPTYKTSYMEVERTIKVSHSITNFEPSSDMSSLLQTMPIIEAHVSGSPPIGVAEVLPKKGEQQSPTFKHHDTSLMTSHSPSEYVDVLATSKISCESSVNISSSGNLSSVSPLSDVFNKLSSSGPVTTSESSLKHNSVPYVLSSSKTTAQRVSLPSDERADNLVLQSYEEVSKNSKPQVRKRSMKSNYSENASGASNVTVKGNSQGFVCNQYLVRDLLNCLKECLVDTSAALYSSLSQDGGSVSRVEVSSSLHAEALQESINRLSIYVSEAFWRLQLVTDVEFTQEVGHISVQKPILNRNGHPSDWVYLSEESESEEESSVSSIAGSSKSKRMRSEVEKSSESGSQSNRSTGGVGMSNPSCRKSHRSKSLPRPNSLFPLPNGIINLMLSSYSSLAVRCLTHGDIFKAKQVIQMFGEEDNPLAVEVKFIEAYQNLITRLRCCVESTRKEFQQPLMSSSLQKKTSTLESIKMVASAGMQSTSLTSQVETFLAVTPIPGIQGADKIITDFPHEGTMLQGIENSAAMTALDLALTIGATYEHSASLLDVACKRCSVLQKGAGTTETNGTRSRSKKGVPGYIWFTKNVIKLLKEANRCPSSHIFPRSVSLCDFFSSECFPFSLRTMKDCVAFWNNLHQATVEFYAALNNGSEKTAIKCDLRGAGVATQTKDISHIAFRRLLEICKGYQIEGTKTGNIVYYLQQVYTYLKLVSSLLHQNFPANTAAQLPELTRPVTCFNLLNDSLMVLLGRLVFECGIPPAHLEPVAFRLKLNLVYNIVCNCCPKIPNSSVFTTVNMESGLKTNWGRMILNSSEQWSGPVRHPEVVVRSLLADVLHIVEEQCGNFTDMNKNILNERHICALAENPVLKTVLKETSELSAVDLNLLVPGDEMLVFYTNLANLMWIHSLLVLETVPHQFEEYSDMFTRTNNSSIDSTLTFHEKYAFKFGFFSSHSLERHIARMSVGYEVGKLGFVSIQEIHQLLLGDLTFPPASILRSYPFLRKVTSEKTYLMESTSSDPRVLFALLNGQKQSPKLQVLYVENVDTQLDNCMSEFLNCHVMLEEGSQQLVIPELLQLYQDHVLLNQEPESHIAVPALSNVKSPFHFSLEEEEDQLHMSYSRERLSQLLDFLRDNTSGRLQVQIMQFADVISSSKMDPVRTTITSCASLRIQKSVNEFSIPLNLKTNLEDNIGCGSATLEGSGDTWDSCNGKWKDRVVQDPVLKFLERHCWLLSQVVQKIHQEKSLHASPVTETLQHKMIDSRTQCLEQLFRSDWINTLKPVFQNNIIVTALHLKPGPEELWCLLDKLVKKQEWQQCADILWALPETELLNNPKLQAFHDIVMLELASKLPSEGKWDPWRYCQHIGDASLQAHCLLQQLPQWPGHGCQYALRTLLGDHRHKLSPDLKLLLQQKLHKISIYEKILPFAESADLKTWYDVSCASENNPNVIIQLLTHAKEFQIFLKWAELHDIATQAQHLIDSKFMLLFLEHDSSDFSASTKLLQCLPVEQTVSICSELIQQLKSVSCLKFITGFLLNSCSSSLSSKQIEEYQKLLIGIQMISFLPCLEQYQHWDLIREPQLIVEQFIMNTRLEMLEKMISEVQPLLDQLPPSSPLSSNSIDSMLRHYAGKALDFRVIQRTNTCRTLPTEEKLMVSLSLASTQSEDFMMPEVVPSKNDWVPNDEATECMCCESVAFSMFNRRHHCRRCGRVVCGSCSVQRTKVAGYGSVPVRVCDDCYEQMCDTEQLMSPMSDKSLPPFSLNSEGSVSPDFTWRLTRDEAHNTTLRERVWF